MKGHIPYNKSLKKLSKKHRNDSTKSEILLWMELRASQMRSYKFNRQKPLLNYIVDFYCKKLNLVIELDGITHYNEKAFMEGEKRQKELEKYDLNFLRFNDDEILGDMENVLRVIKNYIDEFESGV